MKTNGGYAYGSLLSEAVFNRLPKKQRRRMELAWLGELEKQRIEGQRRRIERAIEGDWLDDNDIAAETGVSPQLVGEIRAAMRKAG